MRKILFFILLGCIGMSTSFAATTANNKTSQAFNADTFYMQKPWSMFAYYGVMTKNVLNQVAMFNIEREPSKLYSLELAYQLPETNILNRLIHPWTWSYVGLAFNATYQDDSSGKDIYEANPYIKLSWFNFPWNRYIVTTLSAGEGVSYATRVPGYEKRTASQSDNAKRFLNYLMFEATFALPKHPEWQLVYRIHHRSGCFGLYNSSNSGSTAVGVGIRYLF